MRNSKASVIARFAALWLAASGCKSGTPSEPEVGKMGWSRTPKGSYVVGSPEGESCRRDEAERQELNAERALEVMPTEVTQAQFEARMGYNPSFHRECPECPVDSVTFDEAALYCAREGEAAGMASCYTCEAAGGRDGLNCALSTDLEDCRAPRLPTADEYERFARAGTRGGTYGGEIQSCMARDEVAEAIAWYKSNSKGLSHPVGKKSANPWGLYDVAGNVAEWVHASGESRPELATDFAGLRGGSWYHNAHHLRPASHLRVPKNRRFAYAGFRCVRTAVPPEAKPVVAGNLPEFRPPDPAGGPSPGPEPVIAAAIVYTGESPEAIDPNCHDDNCALVRLIEEAAAQGARLIVTPEYGLAQEWAEPEPALGRRPLAVQGEANLLARFAGVADEADVYLVINAQTYRPEAPDAQYNTVIAFDPRGRVVGRHHKFELYGAERDALTPGEGVTSFDTPFGRVGLLVCADIYGQPALHHELMREQDARIVAWSASWTVEGATRWQSAFARDWNVFFIAANGAKGAGGGGGVFGPFGRDLGERDVDLPIVFAELPI